MPTQFVLETEYLFTVAMSIGEHNAACFLAVRFLALILISHLCVLQYSMHFGPCLFYNQVVFLDGVKPSWFLVLGGGGINSILSKKYRTLCKRRLEIMVTITQHKKYKYVRRWVIYT